MKTPSALDQCLGISSVHARIQLALDEELGIFHGLAYADFILLYQLGNTGEQRLAMAELAPRMGLRLSAVLRQILPLEKIGLVERDARTDAKGRRQLRLRPAGRQVLAGAIETAQAMCLRLVAFDDTREPMVGAVANR